MYLAYMEHWKASAANVHLHAGSAFAKGCEVTRRVFYDLGGSPQDAIELGLEALLKAYGDFECPDDSAKSAPRLAEALAYFFDEAFPMTTDAARPMIMPSGKHAIEFSFAEPLEFLNPETSNPIIYAGRSDMIVEMAQGIFIEDDKTTSQLGSKWGNQWEMRGQFTGYSWAARKANIPVDGVLVRGVAILKKSFNHSQWLTNRPQWEIDRWYEQTLKDLKRMRDCWEMGYWDYNLGESCNEYGGCVFNSICKKDNPEAWLPAYYHQRIWNPLTRTEEEVK